MLPTIRYESRYPKMKRTYMQPWEQGTLLTLLERIEPKRMVEFGVQEGRTASAVLEWIKIIQYYLGVDVPPDHIMPLPGQQPEVPKEAGHMVKSDSRFELLIRTDSSSDHAIIQKGPFDVAFIDGDHSRAGVLRDYDVACKCLRPNGWVFWHDYANNTVEVTDVLDELHMNGHNIVHIDGTMLAYEQL